MVADASRFGQAIAQLPQVAWASAPCHHPAQRAADVGRVTQHVANVGAQQRVGVKPLDQRQPLYDRGLVGQRRGHVLGQLPRPRAGDAAIDRREQAPRARAALRFEHFEARARCRVHSEPRCAVLRDRRQQQRQLPAPRMVEIGDETPGGREHRPAELTEPVERGNAMNRLKPRFAFVAGEIVARARIRLAGHTVPPLGRDQLACADPRECGSKCLGRAFLQLHPPSRDVARGQAAHPAHLAYRREHVRASRLEQRFLGQRAGGYEADDVARHQRLRSAALPRFFGTLGLLGDRHPAAGLDQPREVAFGRMHRHPAHRDRLAVVLAAARQRDVEHAAGGLGVVEEQLEEVAHAVEQQAIAGLALEREVLRHHRGGGADHANGVAVPLPIREHPGESFPLCLRRAAR